MLQNQDIIIFALARHDGPVRGSTSFIIAKVLARNNRVIYVDDPYSYKSILINIRQPEVRRKFRFFIPFADGLSDWKDENVSIKIMTSPPTISINSLPPGKMYSLLQGINTSFIGARIRRVIKKLKLKNIIYINSFNFYYPGLVKYISPSLHVYHCIDGMIKPYTLRHGPRLEEQILKEADAVISTSPELQRAKGKVNPNSFLSTNAADFEHFNKAFSPETPVAPELLNIPRPIIGFYGYLERRFDFSLLGAVARLKPSFSFVLIGPADPDYIPKDIFSIPNIHFIQKQPFSRLPEFLKGFDVAMIPYKVDSISNTIYPLKLFEYLSGGKPVVCTSFNTEVIDITKGVSYIADTPGDFADAIDLALASNNEDNFQLRFEIARQNTWVHKEDEFSKLIESIHATSSNK
jgi:glycosyltransferase involved in cell wall biosynthesis